MLKLTVIMPVYNVEKYVEKSIKSVLNQTMKDFELIIVNDGSTDNSGNICKKYAAIDNRIKYFFKENKGVSSARNFALKKSANSKYITFIDSDDWIEEDFYEKVIKYISDNDLDICITSYIIEEEKKSFINLKKKKATIMNSSEALIEIFKSRYYTGTLWDTFFKKDILLDLSLVEGLRYHEDFLFKVECINKSNKIGYFPLYKYHYVMRSTSVSHTFSRKNLDVLKANKLMCLPRIKQEKVIFDKYKQFFSRFVVELSVQYIKIMDNTPFEHYVKYSQRYARRHFKELITDYVSIKRKLYIILLVFFPFKILKIIYKCLNNIRNKIKKFKGGFL